MNRVAALVVALVVLAGSVPAATALADGAQTGTEDSAPGATFAGVVGVQQAEVDNEVAQRSLDRQFAAAESNDSKAQVVADQQRRLDERLDELEAEKARVEQAYADGNMSRGEYRARLAALGAELRALERRANQTAEQAAGLPEEALRTNGANVSAVREVAQRANRTGGGEVAEAARAIGGPGVGDGLRGPPNGTERGPPGNADGAPDSVGGNDAVGPNTSEVNGTGPGANGPPEGAGPDGTDGSSNRSTPPNAAGGAQNTTNGAAPEEAGQNRTAGTGTDAAGANGMNGTNAVENTTRGAPAGTGTNVTGENRTAGTGQDSNGAAPNASGQNGQNATGANGTAAGNGTMAGENGTAAGNGNGTAGENGTAGATPPGVDGENAPTAPGTRRSS